MGIEDFNLDPSEHTERVLIIGRFPASADKLAKLLARRNYQTTYASSVNEAKTTLLRQVIDLILLDHQEDGERAEQTVASIRQDAYLRRYPILLLCPPKEPFLAHTEPGNELQIMHNPVEPSALVVKVATQLRMRKFKNEQVGFEAQIAAQNSELRDLTNRFKRELIEAREIQESILPKRLPCVPQATFAACYLPVEAVSGDLFDIWQLDSSNVGLLIADVSGHGLPAAFIGAMTKMAVSYAPKDDPASMIASVNSALTATMPEGRFVTLAAAFYNLETGCLQLASAGHPASYVWHADTKQVEQINPKGLALGILPDTAYELSLSRLSRGDKFLMVSDGLTETQNMDGVFFAAAGVAAAFGGSASNCPIGECMNLLLEHQQVFAGGRIVRDDVTMVALERIS
jgi:serine phosphatase RsbU (regulator of sigma subunit)/CheY-like chemotaxis protein